MKCTLCLSTMDNQDERHHVEPDSYRMNLHCFNDKCPSKYFKYIPHFGVIVCPNQPWLCNEYHLPFLKNETMYVLAGDPPNKDIVRDGCGFRINHKKDKETRLYKITMKSELYHGSIGFFGIHEFPSLELMIGMNKFIEISTSDDMHAEAEKLFDKLYQLSVFS